MSQDIVDSRVSGHRGRFGVSGLRGRSCLVEAVPALAMLGFWVLGDGHLVRVGERHGLGVPGGGDLLAFALVADVELVRQDADVAAFGDATYCGPGDAGRGIVPGSLHAGAAGRAGPVVHPCGCRAGIACDVPAVVGDDLDCGLVPQDVDGLSCPMRGDVEHAAENLVLSVRFHDQIGFALAGVERQRSPARTVACLRD